MLAPGSRALSPVTRHPSRLEYRAASHADNTLTIRFPTLRIKRKVATPVRQMQGRSYGDR